MSEPTPPESPGPPPLPSASSVGDGVASSGEAGQREPEEKGRTFPCDGCGGDLVFHIGQQKLECPYCGHVKEITLGEDESVDEQDFHAMLARLAERRQAGEATAVGDSEVRCSSCGASVVFTGTLTSTECAFCGAPTQREDVHRSEDRVPVDGVLSFRVPRERARANLRQWVASRWFAPNEFRRRGVDGKFNGVYMPFWTYDSLTANTYRGQRGKHYWVTVGSGDNKRRVRRTRWYPASGSFQRFFDDVLVCAATGLPRKRVDALEPWPLREVIPFKASVLAGFLAETYSVPLEKGFGEAKGRMDAAIRSEVRRRIGGDTQRIHSINTRHDAITFKHLLLPVWLLTYRYQEKPYRVVVNAATGEVQGDRPWSWVKITLAVLAGIAVVGSLAAMFSS